MDFAAAVAAESVAAVAVGLGAPAAAAAVVAALVVVAVARLQIGKLEQNAVAVVEPFPVELGVFAGTIGSVHTSAHSVPT